MGCRFDNWIRLVRENPISKENRAQFWLMSLVSFVLSVPALLEWLIFYLPVRRTKVKKDPIYIVGFWRSGTTFLQNLLTRDPQFAWFDPLKTVSFNNCILLRPILSKFMDGLLKDARPMDNLEYKTDLPMEEVFAQATLSTQAISHMLVFPDSGNGTRYIETAFIDEQDEKMQHAWRKAYSYLIQKVTYLWKGKQLLLKSPENTCRIKALKCLFPGSKFINIYRNPYTVILSTMNMFSKEMELFRLNDAASEQVIEDVAIDVFARIYRKALPELEAMPPEDRIDICYEEFCKDPKGYVRKIYLQLGIEGYEEALPYFEQYLESQKNYQKNAFELDERLRDKINDRLGFYFDYYGYRKQGNDFSFYSMANRATS